MTCEEGAITGDLVLALADAGSRIAVMVAYAGSEDFLTVEGSPLDASVADAAAIVGWLSRDPGTDEAGNPRASDLAGLPTP